MIGKKDLQTNIPYDTLKKSRPPTANQSSTMLQRKTYASVPTSKDSSGNAKWPSLSKGIGAAGSKQNTDRSSGAPIQMCGGTGEEKTFQTYTKTHPVTGVVYSGRTSGTGTPAENLTRRDANHHMNSKGYGPAVLDKSSASKEAIRGREQMLIDIAGGAASAGGTSGNAIRGIGEKNKKKDIYMKAAEEEFG